MIRLYSFGLLLPLSVPALAQQPDNLAPRRVGVAVRPDSLPVIRPISEFSGFIDKVQGVSIKTLYHFAPLLPLQEQLRQVAGVQATPYSGAPGAGEVVRIRGAASLDSYVQPLYVVDGVPVFQYRFASLTPDEAASFANAGFNPEANSNPLLSIPNEDIESVEVLKGAYATGQYGFLGQNGVVRITTRRGKANQPPRLHYTGYGGVQQARHRYDLLGARELAEVANEASRNNGYAPVYTPDQVATLGQGTDWQDELLRTAAVQEHHLSTDGGTRFGTRYYAAADYLHQTGVVLNSGLQRYALRLSLDQQLGQRIQLSGGLSYGETQVRRPAQGRSEAAVPLALRYLPMVPVYRPDGSYATDYGNPNPLQRARQNYSTPRNRRLLTRAQAQIMLFTGLRLDLRAALEQDSLRAADYQGPQQDSSRVAGLQTGLRRARYQQLQLNPALRYEHTLGERHAVEASAEASFWRRQLSQQFIGIGRSSRPPYAQTGINASDYAQEQRYHAYTLRASYTYASRYTVVGSGQRNTSPQLPADLAGQWLPAVQATWHAGQEVWLKDRTPISQLDAWVGWGRTSNRGNLAGDHGLTTRPANLSFFRFLDERCTQQDAGLDVGLWQNKLRLNTTVYRRETQVRLGNPTQNQVEQTFIRNRGLETTLSASWQLGKLNGSSSLAAAFNHNRYDKPAGSQALLYNPSGNFLVQFGRPVSSFAGYQYLGLDARGNPQFAQSANGAGPERQALTSGLPRQLASLRQTLHYGKLTLELQADGLFGYQVLDTNLSLLDVPTDGFNATTRVRDRWTPTHTDTSVPRAGTPTSAFSSPSSYTLQSGNHVRLSSLTLTAEVWQRDQHSAAVFLSGTNLLVFSKYRSFDPNVSAAEADPKQAGLDQGYYPTARAVLLGVRATL